MVVPEIVVLTAFSSWVIVETLTMLPMGGGSVEQWLAAESTDVLCADSWTGYAASVVPSHVTISASTRTSPKKLDLLEAV
jgi:hypothetical protein